MSSFVLPSLVTWTRRYWGRLCFLLSFNLLSPLSANADVVLFDSGVERPNASYTSDIGSTTINQFIADDFSLDSESLITRLNWTGIYELGVTDDFFEIWIMRDIDPDPDVYLLRRFVTFQPTQVDRLDTGLTISNRRVFEYEADVSSASEILNGEERLFISIFNETSNRWQWGTDTTFGEMYYSNDNTGGTITPFQSTMDFSISGQQAVPEPAAYLILVVLGLFVTLPKAYRRMTRSQSRAELATEPNR